jgi:hypothetical protein
MRAHRFALLALGVAAAAHAENPQLAQCKDLEAEFDYQGMLRECTAAAAESSTSKEERVEALGLLGYAHTALGDDATAQVWFLRLLVIDPEHELPSDISPRFREAFARAQKTFATRGVVSVAHTPPSADVSLEGAPLSLAFDVTDPLGRVAQARLEVVVVVGDNSWPPVEGTLSRMPTAQAGLLRFQGELPDPAASRGSVPERYTLRYRLVLENVTGDEVMPTPATPEVSLPRRGPEGGSRGESDALLWGGAALAGGLLLVGAAGGAVAIYCAVGGCSSRRVPAPIGFVSVSVENGLGAGR